MADFWSTKAGRAAVLAARSQARLSAFEHKGEGETVWAKHEKDLLEQHHERLRKLLSEETARPSDEDVDRAADAVAGRLSDEDARLYGERAIATTLVVALELARDAEQDGRVN